MHSSTLITTPPRRLFSISFAATAIVIGGVMASIGFVDVLQWQLVPHGCDAPRPFAEPGPCGISWSTLLTGWAIVGPALLLAALGTSTLIRAQLPTARRTTIALLTGIASPVAVASIGYATWTTLFIAGL